MERDGEGSNPNLHKANGRKRKLSEVDINEQGLDVVINEHPDSDNIDINCNHGSYSRQEQGIGLPLGSITRIMEKNLPPDAMISKDSKELVQACAKEFISFITDEAKEQCHREARHKLTAEDIIAALFRLGYDNYAECLTSFLSRYRQG